MLYEWESNEDRSVFTLKSGKISISIKRENRFMFWLVTFDRGRTPASLSGVYTSTHTAQKAVEKYLQVRDKVTANAS